jgi:hypothetical protein
MNIFRPAVLMAFALALVACAPRLETLPPAAFKPYEPDLSDTSTLATIRGSFEESTGPLGRDSRSVGVFAIDGKVAFKERGFETPIPLTAGKHSLTIGYLNGPYGDTIPIMLDARPGADYVVKRAEDKNWLDGLKYDRIRTWLYVVDEKTGEVVIPKIPDILQTIEGRYTPPAGADAATMRGTKTGNMFDGLSVFLIAVDGQIVGEKSKQTMWSVAHWDPATPVRLAPGLRALAIATRGGMGNRYMPLLLDVKPGASYVAKVDHGLKRFGTTRIFVYTVWIEDGTTGEIVVPKADIPGAPYPTL